MNNELLKEYNNLVEEIEELRNLMFKSIVDDSSEWYSSLMSSPLDCIIFLKDYFSKLTIPDLTVNEVIEVSKHIDKLEYNQEDRIVYLKFNGRKHLVAESIWMDFEHFKNAVKRKPELFTDSILIKKINILIKELLNEYFG